jgi:hypothetical protein
MYGAVLAYPHFGARFTPDPVINPNFPLARARRVMGGEFDR